MKRAWFLCGLLSGNRCGLRRTGTGFRRRLPGAFIARLLGDQTFGDLCLPFIQFGIARADKMEVLALERSQFCAQIGRTQLAVR